MFRSKVGLAFGSNQLNTVIDKERLIIPCNPAGKYHAVAVGFAVCADIGGLL